MKHNILAKVSKYSLNPIELVIHGFPNLALVYKAMYRCSLVDCDDAISLVAYIVSYVSLDIVNR